MQCHAHNSALINLVNHFLPVTLYIKHLYVTLCTKKINPHLEVQYCSSHLKIFYKFLLVAKGNPQHKLIFYYKNFQQLKIKISFKKLVMLALKITNSI